MSAPAVLAETTQNPLIPASYDIIWSLVAIALIGFFLVRFAVPRLTAMLDERAAKIEAGLSHAEEAERQAAAAEERIAAELADARREAAAVRERAQAEGKQIVAEARARAQAEADRVTESAARQIEADRQAAQISLRTDVGLLATELASRIVGESVADHAVQSRVIDRFLDELEAQGDQDADGARAARALEA
ncbi:F0F1 ATP synthase subunit B [Georgenia sp. TF02-10]|uniref:F0F1 ATP synthase subunit B n=1 Tax=Georgenia sp. TF02-10 TaxID=2917725 RepID=UPI001FA772F5|nr:F0F1 ATP synthase subunit B [Georgenia sp. TF02-10]UNX53978.1 F0F1 ATP synthase subunit B [Georgenia sp. TF02-10]